jgi:WD40 repeat protein
MRRSALVAALVLVSAAQAEEPKTAWPLPQQESGISALTVSADGKRVAAGLVAGDIRVFDAATGAQLARLTGHENGIAALQFSMDDGARLVSLGRQDFVRIWDVSKSSAVRDLPEPELRPAPGAVRALAFTCHPRTKRIAVADGEDVGLFDAATGKRVAKLADVGACVSLAFSPDGARLGSYSILSPSDPAKIKPIVVVRAVTGGKALWSHELSDGDADAAWREFKWGATVFSGDGKALFISGSIATRTTQRSALRRYDAAAGACAWTVETAPLAEDFAVSPDGATVAVASQRGAALHDAATGKFLRRLQAEREGCTAIAFSPDGAWVYGATLKRRVERWDARASK